MTAASRVESAYLDVIREALQDLTSALSRVPRRYRESAHRDMALHLVDLTRLVEKQYGVPAQRVHGRADGNAIPT